MWAEEKEEADQEGSGFEKCRRPVDNGNQGLAKAIARQEKLEKIISLGTRKAAIIYVYISFVCY